MNMRSQAVAAAAIIAGSLLVPGAAAGADPTEEARGPRFTVGAVVGTTPKYEGGKKYGVLAAPFARANWERWSLFLDQRGLGAGVKLGDRIEIDASVAYGGGRTRSGGDRLRGMDKIDAAALARLSATVSLFDGFSMSSALSRRLGDSGGTTLEIGAGYRRALTERLRGSIGLSATWADEDHMKTFFGVTAAESVASGNARFTPSSGFKNVGLNVGLGYALTSNWTVVGGASLNRLLGDAASSPLTEQKTAVSGTLGVTYAF